MKYLHTSYRRCNCLFYTFYKLSDMANGDPVLPSTETDYPKNHPPGDLNGQNLISASFPPVTTIWFKLSVATPLTDPACAQGWP
jgi:hypothetical protein